MIKGNLTYGQREPRKLGLARLTTSVLWMYPIGTVFPPLYANITIGDTWLIIGFAVFGARLMGGKYMDFLSGAYGLVAMLLTIALTISYTVNTSTVGEVTGLAQIVFIIWALIPLVAVGIAEASEPLKMLEIGATIYLVVAAIGLIAFFVFGIGIIFENSGANRYFMKWDFGAFSAVAVPLVVALISRENRFMWKDVVLLAMFLFGGTLIIVADSRTGVVALGVMLCVSMLLNLSRSKVVLFNLAQGLIFFAVFFGDKIRDVFSVEDRRELLFVDNDRIEVMIEAYRRMTSNISSLFFGVGWQSSGFVSSDSRLMVHNVVLGVFSEYGLFAGVLWLAFWLLPVWWLVTGRSLTRVEHVFSILLATFIAVQWMFHPMATVRVGWLGYSVFVGLAYRAREQRMRFGIAGMRAQVL